MNVRGTYVIRNIDKDALGHFRAACIAAGLSPQNTLRDFVLHAKVHYLIMDDVSEVRVTLRYPRPGQHGMHE